MATAPMNQNNSNGTATNTDAEGSDGVLGGIFGPDAYTKLYLKPIQKMDREQYYGDIAKLYPFPGIRSVSFPPPPDKYPVLPTILPESCAFKIVTGALMGSVLGVGLGLFMGAMGDVSPIQIVNGREVPMAPVREQLRAGYKSTAVKAAGWARNFGVLTAMFGGVECLIEKYRGKRDVWNPVVSGCVVGGTLSARGGPAAACVGCAGFAGFSLLMDVIMGPH